MEREGNPASVPGRGHRRRAWRTGTYTGEMSVQTDGGMRLELDFKHPDNVRNPFPLYRWLRERDPHFATPLADCGERLEEEARRRVDQVAALDAGRPS